MSGSLYTTTPCWFAWWGSVRYRAGLPKRLPVSAVILSLIVVGHGSVYHSCRRAGVAPHTREAGGLAAQRLLGGVFERYDFASPYIGFSERCQADWAVRVAVLEEPEPLFSQADPAHRCPR